MDLREIAMVVGGSSSAFRLRQATVTAVSYPTCSLKLAGDSTVLTGVPYMSHVAPKIDSAVWVAVDGRDMMVIGAIAPLGPPWCNIYRSTDQTGVASGTATSVSFNAAASNPWNMWSSGTDITIPLAGVYVFAGTLAFAADSTGTYREARITIGGTSRAIVRNTGTFAAATPTIMNLSLVYACGVGDVVNLVGVANTTGTATFQNTARIPHLGVTYLGPYG